MHTAASNVRPAAGKPPITSHPAFAMLVALWFTALLGLASLILAPVMLERVVAATRLDALVPAAAPPLGATARLLAAFVAAGLGWVLGHKIGRRLATPHRSARAAIADEPEVSERESAAEPSGVADRVAALLGRGDGPRDFDDLPALAAREPLAAEPDAPAAPAAAEPEPAQCDDDEGAEVVLAAASQVGEPAAAIAVPDAVEAAPVLCEANAAPAPPESAVAEPDQAPALAVQPSPVARAALDSLGSVELVERLAIAIATRRARTAAAPTIAEAAPAPDLDCEILARRAPRPAPPLELAGDEDWTEEDFDSDCDSDIEIDDPTAGDDDDDDDDDGGAAAGRGGGYSSLLDMAPSLRRAPPAADDGDDDAVVAFPAHTMRRAAQVIVPPAFAAPELSFVDAEDESVVAPPAGPADPAATDRALRDALARLQRISGTG